MRPYLSGTGPDSEVFSFDSSSLDLRTFPRPLSVTLVTALGLSGRSRQSLLSS